MKSQTVYPNSPKSIEHPNHSIPLDIANSMRAMHEAEFALQVRRNEIAKLARPNQEERLVIAEVRKFARQGGVKAELIEKLSEINKRKNAQIREILGREVAIKNPFERHVWDSKPSLPQSTDPTFWWAKTEWWTSPGFGGFDDDNGLIFLGGVETHDGDLHFNGFSARALFELQPDRLPLSLSGRYVSTPYIDLFGSLHAHTSWDPFEDCWSKCWLTLEQRIFQQGFGEHGPAPVILGEAHEVITLVNEEDEYRFVHAGLPGFKFMPPVTFTNLNRAASLWAELIIRFDIQTEGSGSNLGIDSLNLRTYQWPLTAI